MLIIYVHSILRLLYFPITKIPKGVMKNYFTCKRIKLITPLDILWSENKVISNYNLCKLLNFTKKIEEPHMYAQRLIITNSQNICFLVNHYLLRHKATQVNATFTLKKKKKVSFRFGGLCELFQCYSLIQLIFQVPYLKTQRSLLVITKYQTNGSF